MILNYENMKIKINGVELPAPVQMDYNLEDLDVDSERDVKSAVLDRNRARAELYKIPLAYALNDVETVSTVLNMIHPETFDVEIFDIMTLKRKTIKMYAGPKSMQFVLCDNIWVKALKFNLVEV